MFNFSYYCDCCRGILYIIQYTSTYTVRNVMWYLGCRLSTSLTFSSSAFLCTVQLGDCKKQKTFFITIAWDNNIKFTVSPSQQDMFGQLLVLFIFIFYQFTFIFKEAAHRALRLSSFLELTFSIPFLPLYSDGLFGKKKKIFLDNGLSQQIVLFSSSRDTQ